MLFIKMSISILIDSQQKDSEKIEKILGSTQNARKHYHNEWFLSTSIIRTFGNSVSKL